VDSKNDVSIIIPTFNRAGMLTAAIASCSACSDKLNIEIIVVDDASTEDMRKVGDIAGVTYVKLPINMGRAGARNRGMEIASGRYIKFLDSDDMLEPGALLQEVNLADSARCDIVVSGWRNVRVRDDGIELDLERYQPPTFINIIDDLLAGKAVPTSAALYRSELVKEQRWSYLKRFDDWDFFLRAAARSSCIMSMDQPAYQWRHHAGKRITDAGMLETANSFYSVLDRFADYLELSHQMSPKRRQKARTILL
jgi:glycosyltransferase involved in cell wall biosynthesis